MNSRWLYRAAGTVGLAGGFLLLAAGSAQADETESTDPQLPEELLAEVFSPTAGLPPLDLPAGDPELLPGLPGLSGLPGLPALGPILNGLPSGGVPLDSLGLRDAAIGGLPLDSDLASLDGQPIGLPTRFATDEQAEVIEQIDQAEVIGPGLLQPLTDSLLGSRPLGSLVGVGDLTNQVPVAGPMLKQTTSSLPVVADIMPATDGRTPPGAHHQPAPAGPAPVGTAPVGSTPAGTAPAGADPLGQPAAGGEQLPALIAQELAAEGGYSPEVIGGLPLLAPALEPIGHMVGVGNIANQLPLVGPLAGPALGNLPVVADPAPAGPPPATLPAPTGPVGATEERPYVDPYLDGAGYDRAYPGYGGEAAELLPLDAVSQLPIAGLTQQLPIDALASPGAVLQTLPVVGGVPGLLPL